MHLLELGKTVKKAITDKGSIAWQYNTVGVSDGITMGTEGEKSRIILEMFRTVFDKKKNMLMLCGCDF